MPIPTILLVENGHGRAKSLSPTRAKRRYVIVQGHTFRAAVSRAGVIAPALIIVTATSFKANGARLCQQLRAALNDTAILLVANQPPARQADNGAAATLTPPFTPRKFVNYFTRLLSVSHAPGGCVVF
jgi:DNA-binding response OmpR family regulator